MKLITSAVELETEFIRLMRSYRNYFWISAWAGANSKVFEELISNRDKIKMIAIGIHFYQTHPDFIKVFINDQKVRFIQQPDGTFHPKLYFFFNEPGEWELIVGSPNFTNAAFTKNSEASILLSSRDSEVTDVSENSIILVEQAWNNAKVFNEQDLKNYVISWRIHQSKIKSFSGNYGSDIRSPKPVFEIPILTTNWETFITKVRSETTHGLKRRLRVMEIAREIFSRNNRFSEMSDDERKFIAGIPNRLNTDGATDWGYFGSMKGAGIFKNRILENDINISNALDQIPRTGQITKRQYESYIDHFSRIFTGNKIGTATRLLCMKRPDTFICFDSRNKSALCRDFGIIQAEMNYDRYWEDIILRIYDSEWWLNPNPKNDIELKVSDARAAFLDSLYYEE